MSRSCNPRHRGLRSLLSTLTDVVIVMQNYEGKKASYFATPSPQLIHALHTALTQILKTPLSKRFEKQKAASQRIKSQISDMGLKQLATKPENQANGMTAIWLPEGLAPPDVLPLVNKKGVIFAAGLHKEIAQKYIRFGHMGVSVMEDEKRGELEKAVKALGDSLVEVEKKPQ